MTTSSIIIRVSILVISLALHLLINIKISKRDFKNLETESKKEINMKDFIKKYWIVQTVLIFLIGIAYVFIFPSTVILSMHRIAFAICTLLSISCIYCGFTFIYKPHHYKPNRYEKAKFFYIFLISIVLILYMFPILSAFISLNLIKLSDYNKFPSITNNKYDLLSPSEIEKEDSLNKYDKYYTMYEDEDGNVVCFIKDNNKIRPLIIDKNSVEYIIANDVTQPYIVKSKTTIYKSNKEFKKEIPKPKDSEITYIIYCNEDYMLYYNKNLK